jgi:hypothetical protein
MSSDSWQAKILKLRESDKFCDTTLVVGDRKFFVHRSLVAVQSKVWEEVSTSCSCICVA